MKRSILSVSLFLTLASTVALAQTGKNQNEVKHGTAEDPPSRQYYCYSQQDYNNGSGGIVNAACKEAYEKAGSADWERARIFDNWNSYSQNLANSQDPEMPKDLVPDGKLCSAGKPEFDSINLQSDAWHITELEARDGRIQLSYLASQMHDPSIFRVFFTDQAHLTWNSLKESPEVTAEGTPESKSDKTIPGRYNLNVKLPEGYISNDKSLIFIMWERHEDPARETFFSCSDVIIKPA